MMKLCEHPECKRAAVAKNLCKIHHKKQRRSESAEVRDADRAQSQRWRSRNKDRNLARLRQWRAANKEKVRLYRKDYDTKRKKADINYRLMVNLRSRLSHFCRCEGINRNSHVRTLIGCTSDELRSHLQSLFQPGMTWNNYGRKGWHVDHKVALSEFDLSDPAQLEKACHYTNLQPMWHLDNIRKGGRNRS